MKIRRPPIPDDLLIVMMNIMDEDSTLNITKTPGPTFWRFYYTAVKKMINFACK